jgi:hypothetical protein
MPASLMVLLRAYIVILCHSRTAISIVAVRLLPLEPDASQAGDMCCNVQHLLIARYTHNIVHAVSNCMVVMQ